MFNLVSMMSGADRTLRKVRPLLWPWRWLPRNSQWRGETSDHDALQWHLRLPGTEGECIVVYSLGLGLYLWLLGREGECIVYNLGLVLQLWLLGTEGECIVVYCLGLPDVSSSITSLSPKGQRMSVLLCIVLGSLMSIPVLHLCLPDLRV